MKYVLLGLGFLLTIAYLVLGSLAVSAGFINPGILLFTLGAIWTGCRTCNYAGLFASAIRKFGPASLSLTMASILLALSERDPEAKTLVSFLESITLTAGSVCLSLGFVPIGAPLLAIGLFSVFCEGVVTCSCCCITRFLIGVVHDNDDIDNSSYIRTSAYVPKLNRITDQPKKYPKIDFSSNVSNSSLQQTKNVSSNQGTRRSSFFEKISGKNMLFGVASENEKNRTLSL